MLYVINKIDKTQEEVTNFVYDTKEKAYTNFTKLFHGRETDNDGDTPKTCFYEFGGARFNDYDLSVQTVNLNEKCL